MCPPGIPYGWLYMQYPSLCIPTYLAYLHVYQHTYTRVGAVAVLPSILIVHSCVLVGLLSLCDEPQVLPGLATGLWREASIAMVRVGLGTLPCCTADIS